MGVINQQPNFNNKQNIRSDNMMQLGGVSYGTEKMPAFYLHSNIGITFDLEMIRSSLPHTDITLFTAKCGIRDIVASSAGAAIADFWVLVDGIERFSLKDLQPGDAHDISIELKEQDRFLTLLTTDNNSNISNDWCILGLPRLELETKKINKLDSIRE